MLQFNIKIVVKVRALLTIIAVSVSLLLGGCGGGETFTLAGTVEGLGTQPVKVVYEADGRLHCATVTAIDGKLRYEGVANEPAIVSLFGPYNRIIGRAYVVNGETVEGEWSLGSPCKVKLKGNGVSERWGRFLTENADSLCGGDVVAANRAVARYIGSHRDDVLSAILLMTAFDASDDVMQADSLMRLLSPDARPDGLTAGYRRMLAAAGADALTQRLMPITLTDTAGDALYFNPGRQSVSLLCFTGTTADAAFTSRLLGLRRDWPEKRIGIYEMSLQPDYDAWRGAAHRDSATWPQGWLAGGVSHKAIDYLAIPRLPYFIVADSTSRQLYRGTSLDAAISSAKGAIR